MNTFTSGRRKMYEFYGFLSFICFAAALFLIIWRWYLIRITQAIADINNALWKPVGYANALELEANLKVGDTTEIRWWSFENEDADTPLYARGEGDTLLALIQSQRQEIERLKDLARLPYEVRNE